MTYSVEKWTMPLSLSKQCGNVFGENVESDTRNKPLNNTIL